MGGGGGGGGSSSQSSTTTNQDNRVVGNGESVGVSGSSNVQIIQNRTVTDLGTVAAAGQVAQGALDLAGNALKSNNKALTSAFDFATDSSRDAFKLTKEMTNGALSAINKNVDMTMNALKGGNSEAINAVQTAFSEAKGVDQASNKKIIIIAGVAVAGMAAVAIAARK